MNSSSQAPAHDLPPHTHTSPHRKEVFYFQKMEVSDYNNDVILAAACRADVDKFCKKVEPGEGRIHACLRSNANKLSQQCRCGG